MDRRFKAWLAAAALALAAAPALAQHPAMPADRAQEAAPSLPESLTAGEVRDVVSRLSDEEVRSLLIQQLDKVATADAPAEGSAADQLVAAGDRAHENLVATLDTAPRFGSALAAAWETFTQGVDIGSGRIALAVLLAIVATIVAERVFVSLVGSIGRGGSPDHARGALSRCGLLAARMVCDLLAIGAGLLAAAGVLFVVLSSAEHAPQVLARVFGAVAIIRGAAAISKAVLAPRTPWLRPLPISDAIARGVHARFVLFVALWFLSGLPARSLAVLGAEPRVIGLVNLVTSVVLIGGLVAMALQARVPVARYIRSAAGEGWQGIGLKAAKDREPILQYSRSLGDLIKILGAFL